jgi:hypothetical protein
LSDEPNNARNEPALGAKSPRQLRKEMHELLRSAAVESGVAREVAIRGLASLYGELARDTQSTEEDRLAALRLVRNRLVKISDELTKSAKRAAVKKSSPVMAVGADKAAADQDSSLPQGPIKTDSPAVASASARGGAQAPDDGEALVDLIQRTIAPQTWDVNGGPGVIRYYANGQALVIRQTSDVHDNLVDVLGQLRK